MAFWVLLLCFLTSKLTEVDSACGEYRPLAPYYNLTMNLKFNIDIPCLVKTNMSMQQLKEYIPKWIAATEYLFHRPAWSFPVKLNVINIEFLWSIASLKSNRTLSEKLIYDYCMWQSLKRVNNQTHINWYYPILLTGLDLYSASQTGNEIDSLGATFTGGHCTLQDSCAVIEYYDDLEYAAIVLAHELAHSLGAYHDGQTECREDYAIMRDEMESERPTDFSNCSRSAMENFFKSNESWCLGDKEFRYNISEEFLKKLRHLDIHKLWNIQKARVKLFS